MARALAQRPLGLVKPLLFKPEGPPTVTASGLVVNGSLTSTVAECPTRASV